MEIRKKLNAWRAAWFCLRAAGTALDCLAAAFWLAVLVAGAAMAFGLTREQRLLFTAFAAAWLVRRLAAGFASFLPALRRGRFAALVEAAVPGLKGKLVSALDLSAGQLPPGASPDFVRRHLEETAGALKISPRPAFISIKELMPRPRLILLASGFCAAAVLAWSDPEAFYWFLRPLALRPLENMLEIKPGDACLLKGRPFKIEAVFRNGGEGEPELFLHGPGEPWSRGFMAAAGPGRFVYAGDALEADLLYRLKHRELQSRVYRLTAEEPPALKDIVFSVSPPAYTGEKGFSYPYLPQESGVLKGSLVSVSGAPAGRSFSAALVFDGTAPLPMRAAAGGRLAADFTVEADVSYLLSLKTSDGEAGTADRRVIRALGDRSPSVEVLSPAFGALEAAPEEELPAVYEASDDIGLKEIRLLRKAALAGKPVPALSSDAELRAFTGSAVRHFSGETDLSLYDLPDGTEAEFYLLACDRSPDSNCARSGAVRIKVTDFSARHASAYAGLDALKKELAALKANESDIISGLGKGKVFTAEEMAAYAAAWKKTAGAAGRLGAELKKDPYMGTGTLARYELFRDDLEYGAETAGMKAAPETLSGPAAKAAKTHEALKSSLEDGERDLESVLRSEDARSSVAGFDGMARKASDMSEELAGLAENAAGGPGSGADWQKLSRTLEKISAELSRIRSLLASRPPQKSDGRVFSLPAGSALETAGELAAAIKSRDAGKAAALAAALAEKLSQMRRVMEEYASYRASKDERRESGEKASELSGRWKALYDAQSSETEAGRELGEKLLAKTERARAALLAELAASTGAAESAAAAGKTAPGAYTAVIQAEERLKAGDAQAARAAFESALAEIGKSTCVPCAAVLRAAAEDLRGRLAVLVRLESDAALFGPADLALFPAAADRQEKIRADSAGLAAYITGGYSGAVAGRLLEKLEKAGAHMAKAEEALSAKNIKSAGEEQLKALDELELGDRSLDDMLQKMNSASSGMGSSGRPSGVFTRPAPGIDAAPVKLPKAGDYVPPRELRERVMESLRERYPAAQKDLIEGYLKNVAK